MTTDGRGRRRTRLTATVTDLEVTTQRALLVGMVLPGESVEEAETSLLELELLTDTAGSDPQETVLVPRRSPDPATFVGRGKAEELAAEASALDIDVVVFDNDLTPAQQRNLQGIFECDVVDREALILDIFAQHATSSAGMLQVELALLRYHLPRLRGKGDQLSRQAGRIGTRGPGETKLESDRRRILRRISRLERELKELRRVRATQRKARLRSELPVVSLVGYTNAGKSTLLNRVTEASVLTEDRLFSTLDPTVRRCDLPGGPPVLLSDTVGFVRRLPHHLVEAFRSTLEEVAFADLLVHVVDGSDPNAEGQIDAVHAVIEEIRAEQVPELLVFNKIDLADPVALRRLRALHPDAQAVSALDGTGTEELLNAIGEALRGMAAEADLHVPYTRGDVLAALYRDGEVIAEEHGSDGTSVRVRLPKGRLDDFTDYVVG